MKWSSLYWYVVVVVLVFTGTKSVPALMLSLRNLVEFIKRTESFQRVNCVHSLYMY